MDHPSSLRTVLLLGLLGAGCAWPTTAATAADPPSGSVLLLTDDGSLTGRLEASADPAVFRWQSPSFTGPIDFPQKAIRAVRWQVSGLPPRPRGEYCFELAGEDLLYGDLIGLSGDLFEIESSRFGRLHVHRKDVRRIYRWNGAELVYFGPHGLSEWKEPAGAKLWREEGGALASNNYDASAFAALGLPEKAMVELDLSWRKKPDFILELGVEERKAPTRRRPIIGPEPAAEEPNAPAEGAFRIEVWDDELVIVGESKRDADLASLQKIAAGEGKAHIQIYLDQAQKRAIVLSRSGQALATLKFDARNGRVLPGVRLTNKSGDVRLESLRITRWGGAAPTSVADKARVLRADGTVVYGQLKAYDPKTKQFTLLEGNQDRLIQSKELADILLAPASPEQSSPATGQVRAEFRDGSRLSGKLTRIETQSLDIRSASVKESLSAKMADLQAVVLLQPPPAANPPGKAGRPGRLKMDGVSLNGRLVDGPEKEAGRMVWQPDLALQSSSLVAGASGAIVYKEPAPPNPQPQHPQPAVPQRGAFDQLLTNLFESKPPTPAAPATGRKSLHLRSGDVIPCEVQAIDERGLTIQSPLSAARFVANDKIKSVELVSTETTPKLDEAKRDRLLTLPRLQKDSPPTHLICSRNGDFLRGRILEMNEKTLKVEVRLEVREIPRDRVAQIIWLHADELTAKPAPVSPGPTTGTQVQVMRADGNRLTFRLQKAGEKTIAGISDVLGECHADLADIDQVLFGNAIEDSAAKLAYNLWKLHQALEPRYVEAGAGESADGEPGGKNSPLVGQEAFAFKLPMLDGPDYDLAAKKGKIVVLDFWATWCGPCMQTAPLFEEVMRDFAGRDVEFVGINMEEQPDLIKSMLERHKLKFRVALDRDGGIAARYSVTAIPQTVVIDRNGKIARLFVGGGKKTAEALHKAIDELLAAKP